MLSVKSKQQQALHLLPIEVISENFLKAVLAGVAIFLGVQVGRDLAHKTMAATTTTPAAQ